MSRSSVLASLASQDVSASEFDKLDADNGSDYQSQVDLKSPLASPTFTGSITTPEIRSGSTLTIDPATVGDNTGLVLLKGNLQVDGTSTTINSTTLTVDDLNLTLASGAADSAAANGAGITIDGASATMTYTHSTTSFDFNKPVNVTGNASVSADLTVDTSTLKVDSSNNRVGIGTASPSELLTLQTATTSRMTMENTGDAGVVLTMDADRSGADQGLGSVVFKWNGTSVGQVSASSGADTTNKDDGDLTFSTTTSGGSLTERMRIDSSGNVGIGDTPDHTLHVEKSISAGTAVSWIHNSNNVDATDGLVVSTINNNSAVETFHVRSNNSTATNGNSLFLVRGDGKVGIGETNPVLPLHVSHSSSNTTINDNSAANCGIMLQNTSNTDGAYTGIWSQDADNDATNAGIIFKNVSQSDSTASMHFLTRPSGSGAQEVMTIDKDGKVGIGAGSPAYQLHIKGTGGQTLYVESDDQDAFIYLDEDGSNNAGIIFRNSATEKARLYMAGSDDSLRVKMGGADRIHIDDYGITDSNTAYRTSLGWAATAELESCALQVNCHRYYHQGIVVKDKDGSTAHAGTLMTFYRVNTAVGSITTTGSATAFNTSSDYRLKYDIKDMGSGLNIINDLKPRTFKWLVNKDTKRDDGTKFKNPDTYGFIAHEVEEAIPRANDIGFVQGEKDGEEYQSVDYTKFSPIIIKAIQELSAKVTALENAS